MQIEFQPSSFSKGTYCNVGISFLFEYFGELNKTLAFNFGTRRISSDKSEFIEYTGNDNAFEAQLLELTHNAWKYAEFCGTETTAESAKAKVHQAISARRSQTKIDQFKHRATNPVSTPSSDTDHPQIGI